MPHDFRNKSFQKVLRGYAPEEVDDYIAYLNEEYRKLERRTADSERKLALALKKLDENAKGGSADSVGPAAREAAAKLLREAENKRSEILAMTEQQANENAERIIRGAEAQAAETVNDAVQQAEAILAEAKAEAEAHRDDVQKVYNTARGIYDEIGTFREKLFGLYNDHLDAIEGITEEAKQFMGDVDGQYPDGAEVPEEPENEEISAATEEPYESEEDEDLSANLPAEDELPMEEEADLEESPAEELPEEEYSEEDYAEDEMYDETAEDEIGEEIASNLAFMDKLFADLKKSSEESSADSDLYIDIPEDEEFEEIPEELDEADLPAITIDWKNRSAVDLQTQQTQVKESDDFRPADGFDELDDGYEEYEEEEYEENYDEYGTEYVEEAEEAASEDEYDEEDPEAEEDDEYSEMDALFNEDKSQRDMSLTDEFNIIFADSKSSDNVKEIRRQPTIAPEAPKNPKKHKNF